MKDFDFFVQTIIICMTMRNTIFLLFFLYSSAVYAQYCCTEQGTVIYYVT